MIYNELVSFVFHQSKIKYITKPLNWAFIHLTRILCEHTLLCFWSAFEDTSHQQVPFQLVTQGCQLLWHSITLLVPAITKVPQLEQRRSLHPSSDWLIWPGQESKFYRPKWKALSTPDRDYEDSAKGHALFNIFSVSESQKKKNALEIHGGVVFAEYPN